MKYLLYSAFVIALFSACQQQTESKWEKITFQQGKPALVHLNLGDTSNTHGDGMAFEAEIKDEDGNIAGEVLGWLITVDIIDGDSIRPINKTERIGTMIFNLGDENEIIAQGGTTYNKGEQQMRLGISQKRAIVGGTGKYKGIEGEVTTTRNDDGTYTHLLDIKVEQ